MAPASVREASVSALRAHFNDAAILEINSVVAYMNFVNRIALGLGVELENSLQKFTR